MMSTTALIISVCALTLTIHFIGKSAIEVLVIIGVQLKEIKEILNNQGSK